MPSICEIPASQNIFVTSTELCLPVGVKAGFESACVTEEVARTCDVGVGTNRDPADKLAQSHDASDPCRTPCQEADLPTEPRNGVKSPVARDAATITDLCYKDDVAEVNLISLVHEQIPRYVLRSDTLTDFAGYDNADWIQTPCIPPDADLNLTPELIEETLKYFILCAERVSQMTKTYNDIDAVTHLLEEKERDLELAARIGQSLLQKNKDLTTKNEELEETLIESCDNINQLKHDLSVKEALLQVYADDYESDSPGTPTKEKFGIATLDNLQKKVQNLELENLNLKSQAANLKYETAEAEEKEESLTRECVRQLSDVNEQVMTLHEELSLKGEVNSHQQEEITSLMTKIIQLESKIKKLTIENVELQKHLNASREAQKELTVEIGDWGDKYTELYDLLQESQDEVKALRRKQRPNMSHQHFGTFSPFLPEGSLAHELEDSLRKDLSYRENSGKKSQSQRAMETARYVRRSTGKRSQASLSTADSCSSGNESCESIAGSSVRGGSLLPSEAESSFSGSEGYYCDTESMYSATSSLGRPGIPGSNDLETALRRLNLRKDSTDCYEEQRRKRSMRAGSHELETPPTCRTPDSFMSTESASNLSDLSKMSGNSYKLPEKLQIVKPLEGSMTLHKWQTLATPHFGNLLEQRPGVQNKGEELKLDEPEDVYYLSDYEEDDEYDINMAKRPMQTSSVYTYTTAKITHPNDEYASTSCTNSFKLGNYCSSTSASSLGAGLGSMGTTTFSMSYGLANVLHERDTRAKPISLTGAPNRFESLVSETLCKCSHSQTESVYSTASASISPSASLNTTATRQLSNGYLDLVNRVKDIGLNNIMCIAKKSALTPVCKNPVDVGLNSVMYMKRKPVKSMCTRAAALTQVTTASEPLDPILHTHSTPVCSSQKVSSDRISASPILSTISSNSTSIACCQASVSSRKSLVLPNALAVSPCIMSQSVLSSSPRVYSNPPKTVVTPSGTPLAVVAPMSFTPTVTHSDIVKPNSSL